MNGENINRINKMLIDFKDEIKGEFRHQLAIQSEAIHHKLDIVVEGHHMLAEKIDRMGARLDARFDCVINKLDKVAAQGDATAAKLDAVAAQGDATAAKLDALAADLTAHRADTEAHHGVYRVKE